MKRGNEMMDKTMMEMHMEMIEVVMMNDKNEMKNMMKNMMRDRNEKIGQGREKKEMEIMNWDRNQHETEREREGKGKR